MTITNITKLQVRRGDRADLPQLDSAELGWATDTQQLFIGNGSLAEGAPYLGNSEILTEHSDIFQQIGTYSFQGNSIGQTINTGITRTLQDRLDDYVSIRAFGNVDSGIDCSSVINAALTKLYGPNSDRQTRIGLLFPAGVYNVSVPLLIPPNAFLIGEGMGNTIIRGGRSSVVIKTVDSLGQYGVNMGAGLGLNQTLPTNIFIGNMSLQHSQPVNITELQSTTQMYLDKVEFVGVFNPLNSLQYQTQTGLVFTSPGDTGLDSGKIFLNSCRFKNLGIGLDQREYLSSINLNQCSFESCNNGIIADNTYAVVGNIVDSTLTVTSVTSGKVYIGSTLIGVGIPNGTVITDKLSVNIDGTGTYSVNTLTGTLIPSPSGTQLMTGVTDQPIKVSVQNSSFDAVVQQAIIANGTSTFVSTNNHYLDVGGGNGTPTSILSASSPGCVSWADFFDRAPDVIPVRFEVGLEGVGGRAVMDPLDRMSWGYKETLRTRKYSLVYSGSDPVYSGTLPEIAFNISTGQNSDTSYQEIRYLIKRSGNARSGTLRLAANTNGVSFRDNYDYVGISSIQILGITLNSGVGTSGWSTGDTVTFTNPGGTNSVVAVTADLAGLVDGVNSVINRGLRVTAAPNNPVTPDVVSTVGTGMPTFNIIWTPVIEDTGVNFYARYDNVTGSVTIHYEIPPGDTATLLVSPVDLVDK